MNSADLTREISSHINANLCNYFPNLRGMEIRARLLSEQHRDSSSIYRFEIINHPESYRILAKGTIPSNDLNEDEKARIDSRPRLSPGPMDRKEKTRLEHGALLAIQAYFERLGNPDLGAIRVLDYIPCPQTIIMAESNDPSLRSLYIKTHRLNQLFGRSPDLRRTFFNAGAWLKAYSLLPKVENVVTRLPHREDFNTSIIDLTGYLSRVSGDTGFFRVVEKAVIPAANEILPDCLPLGIGHGDYAMRNLLVAENDRITALDTCAKWRVPIYEDIAYFLLQLETNGLQAITQGYAIPPETTASYREAFLRGYFGQTQIPTDVIRLFEIQLLLDSWSSHLSKSNPRHAGMRAAYQKVSFALVNRRYRTVMRRLLHEVTARTVPAGGPAP